MTLSLGAAWVLNREPSTALPSPWPTVVMAGQQANDWLYAMIGVTETPPP